MANNLLRDQIKHIVVLMMENRSFDNMLGWLYDPQNSPPFDQPPSSGTFEGVQGKNLSNPNFQGVLVPVAKGTDLTAPVPDPGEPYQDVYAQIYGQKIVLPLGQVPPQPPTPANMQGFLYNYTLQCQAKASKTNPNVIMNGFTQASVPTLWSLGFYYGICDHWFSSIPTQTLCNRSFLHAGTSSGYVNNEGGDGILFCNETPTIFNVMSQTKKSWKIFCNSWMITSLALLTQQQLWNAALSDHFAHLHDFSEAAKTSGGLPQYSFIEPIYLDSLYWGAENDMHPEADSFQFYGPSNVEQGERLLYTVYNAVRNSPDWTSTLLLILFDEHGGCYDHLSPPTSSTCNFAISPDGIVIPPAHSGGSGFQFDRLGVRVPAIVVSAYTPERTVVNTVYDHTSVLKTISTCFDLPIDQLGNRAKAAPDLSDALTLGVPRTEADPIAPPPGWDASLGTKITASTQALLHARNKPLSDLQKKILLGAAHRLGADSQTIIESKYLQTHLEADVYLMKLETQLLAKKFGGKSPNPKGS